MTMHFWILSSFSLAILVSGAFGADYYGKEVGPLREYAHEVRGMVYLVDETTIRIRNFNYDGTGPGGVVFVAFEDTQDAVEDEITVAGFAIADPDGKTDRIRAYNEEDILIKMPEGKTVRTLLWLSIWCHVVESDFGSILFSSAIRNDPPTEVNLGPFNGRAHDVSSGDVILLNSKTIMIKDLVYDGTGPAAWFLVGPHQPGPPETFDYVDAVRTPIVPDETGSVGVLSSYSGDTITITLPEGYDIRGNNLRWLNIYCIEFTANFGEVTIPADVNVIPYLGSSLTNCEKMNDDFAVAWQIDGDDIKFEFIGKIDDDQYMSFGLSGSSSGTSMDNADVVVAHFSANQAMADDYDLNLRAQCSGGVGACPDDRVTGAEDNISGVSGSRINGITRVKFQRKLNTGDTTGDKIYSTSGSQYIVWAIGRLNPDLIATKHSITINPADNKQLEFGRDPENKCTPIEGTGGEGPSVQAWSIPQISGETVFDVTIGPSGGDKGYSAITGTNAWGIAYYVNGFLIPKLRLERGETYTFRIRTGDDTSNLAEYHPFYITSDPDGGHKQKSAAERSGITIYAGLDNDGNPLSDSVGPLCEYKKPIDVSENDFATFAAFKATLTQSPANCAQSNDYTELTWTVPENAPSLVYYHCWTHKYIGWKICLDDAACEEEDSSSSFVLPSMITMIIAICLTILHM